MTRSIAVLATLSCLATAATSQDQGHQVFDNFTVQDLLVPQFDGAPQPVPGAFLFPLPDQNLPAFVQNLSEDDIYDLVRDPNLVGDPALTDEILRQAQNPLARALAQAAGGTFEPSQDEFRALQNGISQNGSPMEISDFMSLSASSVEQVPFSFSFNPESREITQEFEDGAPLSLSIELAALNVIIAATRGEPELLGLEISLMYQNDTSRRDQALSYLSSPDLPAMVGVAAIEKGFELGAADFLRALLTNDQSLLDDDAWGLDLAGLQRLAERSAETPDMQIFLGDIYLQQGDEVAALNAFSDVPATAPQAQQALGRQALASLLAPGSPNALEETLAEQFLMRSLLDHDEYAAGIVLAQRAPFSAPVRLAAATNVRMNPASTEQLTQARQAVIEACDETEARDEAMCSVFDLVYVTNRNRNPEGSDVLFGTQQGPLASGIVRTRLPVAFELAMADSPDWWDLRCSAGRWSCPRALEQLLKVADSPAIPADELPERVDDFDQTISDALAHFPSSQPQQPRALIFIHGFNIDFAEAVDAVARLMLTARYPSTPYLFSWPSQGRVLKTQQLSGNSMNNQRTRSAYQADRNAVTAHCKDMRDAMRTVISRYGAGQVDIVAHSMGNQLLWEMLQGCGDPNAPALTDLPGPPFRAMILAAADLSLNKFRNHQAAYVEASEELVIYASPSDMSYARKLVMA